MRLRVAAAAAAAGMLLVLTVASSAGAQTPQVRLAASTNCPANVNCIPGFKRVYGVDPTSVYTPLAVADAGVQALDDGIAEVAVVFSSNPQLSRPDILRLRDDRGMISDDHIVPVIRRSRLLRYGRPLRRRLNTASQLLSTRELRDLNQQVIDGRIPEAVGGEFADANGLGGPHKRRHGPRVRVGYQAFDENQTLAHFYAEALRGAGYRVRVKPVGGLRPEAVAAMREHRIDLWPGYSGSLLGYLGGSNLRRALKPIGAVPLRRSPAQDRNGFAMKRDTAGSLGISMLSDLKRYWPAAAASASRVTGRLAAADPRQGEQWAVAEGSVLDLPGAWQLTQGQGVTVAIVDTGARLDHTDLAPNVWTNFDEIPDNRVDDDRNGYVDDVHGVDLSSKNPGQDLHDGHGHGTHVAGIVGAAANGRGVVGVAPRAKLMIVKVLDDNGAGTSGSIAEAIRYAAANGARVINCSLGGDAPDPRLTAAVQAAGEANALVVAAAGNDGRDIDTRPIYPAAIPASNLLAVASTDPDSGRAISQFSNFGRLTVQVAAPGAQILSSVKDGGWGLMSGTSMAAPVVTGVAALAASVNPRIAAVDLRAVLMQNATRSRLPVAAGYVDALRSVLAASHSAGYDSSQPPRLRIMSATRKGNRTKVQAAVLGSTAAIRRYRVTVGGTAAELRARRSPFTINLRRGGTRVRVAALDANAHAIASAQRKVTRLRKGKRSVGTGGSVGT
jgi:subtilisin family serine protease